MADRTVPPTWATILRKDLTITQLQSLLDVADTPTPVSGDSLAVYKGWGRS